MGTVKSKERRLTRMFRQISKHYQNLDLHTRLEKKYQTIKRTK